MRRALVLFLVVVLGLVLTTSARTQSPALWTDLVALARGFDIPFETFTLDNGLRVVVHEDRKAPIVAVSIWYNVGAKDEPEGRTGFAHLFEHLMFAGSENAPGTWFNFLRNMGATDLNGTTSYDRTNYFQTVPSPALEQTLYLESDRMGHLLGAINQERLANQRGVVQNEKRQGDNQPFGLTFYRELEVLFPAGHPYRHPVIGSMADLDAATIGDVRQWFSDKYAPNNAVLALAGDLDAATAQTLVGRYFGHIPRGRANVPATATVPTLPAPVSQVMHDRVANTRLIRTWIVPGLLDEASIPLDVGARVLGGLVSSRLVSTLVRGDQSATSASAYLAPYHRIGMFRVVVNVKPGVDADSVATRLDAVAKDFFSAGPTPDEVRRAVMSYLSERLYGLDQSGGFSGKAATLAEGIVYADDPAFYRIRLAGYARATPEDVKKALDEWLTRPAFSLKVEPGDRDPYVESNRQAATAPAAATPAAYTPTPRHAMPEIGVVKDLEFPNVRRGRLSNGIEVLYVQTDAVPAVHVAVELDAGIAADRADRLGTQRLMLDLLTEGTRTQNAVQLAEAQERLGADISAELGWDRTSLVLFTPAPNLSPALDLLADVTMNPAFAPGEVERLRAQQLSAIASQLTQPAGLGQRVLLRELYGPTHPYGRPTNGLGKSDAVSAVTRDDLIQAHQSWIRPDNARIFAVGNLPEANVMAALEERFGRWTTPSTPRGVKAFETALPAPRPRIVLVDRPQSPQSLILAGSVLPVTGRDDLLTLTAANDVVGNDFLSRINTHLREVRGWSYGVSGVVSLRENRTPYLINAPVQADRTGESIAELIEQYKGFLMDRGVTPQERERTINGNTRRLAGSFERSVAILNAMRANVLYNRPDNYWETVASRYHAMTAAHLDRAAREIIDPNRFLWVVVGDARVVRPQLANLGMTVETGSAE